MSHQTKAHSIWGGGAATTTKGAAVSRVGANVVGEVVRFRTFPSETSRRLMATMALAMDMPRALMKMEGGAVGHVDIPHDSPDDVSDADWSDAESEGGVEDVEEVDDWLDNTKEGGKKKQKPRTIFHPSKMQMARTISKCLPKQDVEQFELLFKTFQGVTECPSGCDNCGTDVNAFIIKTRVGCIDTLGTSASIRCGECGL
ncbi:hypothetical protein MHU86_24914 [Fragilaria crotonensis]|nr:hypothetical protein MHU86_24914 [Fragilaria crotonensis]